MDSRTGGRGGGGGGGGFEGDGSRGVVPPRGGQTRTAPENGSWRSEVGTCWHRRRGEKSIKGEESSAVSYGTVVRGVAEKHAVLLPIC